MRLLKKDEKFSPLVILFTFPVLTSHLCLVDNELDSAEREHLHLEKVLLGSSDKELYSDLDFTF